MASNHRSTPAVARGRPAVDHQEVSPREVNQLMLDLTHRTQYLEQSQLKAFAHLLKSLYEFGDPDRRVRAT